jgi:ribosomal protein S12 methylthiotransferase
LQVGMVSLGCSKNLVDSEIMLGQLKKAGFVITNREKDAEILIVNTCAFILPAIEESIKNILELARLKEDGRCRILLVAGCLSQRFGHQLLKDLPEVDGVIGTGAAPDIVELVNKALAGERVFAVGKPYYEYVSGLTRLQVTPPYTAYVKIADGCSHYCSFCAIPSIRGGYRSRTLESIEEEAAALIQKGVKEIVLIAQDTSRYGLDLYGEYKLPELIRRLQVFSDLIWLRLLYCSPDNLNEEMIQAFAESKKFCRYVDIPIQHASNAVLKRMNRRKNIEEIRNLLVQLRQSIPGITLRSTFLTGFPGENDADFNELMNFLKEISFDHAGVFKYFPEEGTRAASMPGQIPDEIKEQRYHSLMTLQRKISRQINKGKIGQKLTVLVEGKRGQYYYGRTEGDAPEIDGKVYLSTGKIDLFPGDFVSVLIKQAAEYDLTGEIDSVVSRWMTDVRS